MMTNTKSTAILALLPDELKTLLAEWGEKKFRAKQLWTWLHQKRVTEFSAMSNLSEELRARLGEQYVLRSLHEVERHAATDGLTEKWLFSVPPSDKAEALPQVAPPEDFVEAVLIREKKLTRHTLCVSCSVGCPIGCVFCATGQGGFVRNLLPETMIEQVYRADAAARTGAFASAIPTSSRHTRGLSNLVFMGMGEPLLNYDAVMRAVAILGDQSGMAFGGRQLTLSTVGVIEGIDRLREANSNLRLAVSLHAPDQALREELVPLAKRWPLEDLMTALRLFTLAGGKGRHVFIEYCLIDGVNARVTHAHALARLLRNLPCKVNLIPLNPTDDYEKRPPSEATVFAFRDILEKNGITCTVRYEKGQDINAACGQLRVRRDKNAENAEVGDKNT